MKSFVAVALFLIAVSIACTSYKSSGSPPLANSNATINQLSTEPINATVQEKSACTLTMTSAPNIKGLRLGMTPDDVLALFPGSKADKEVSASLSQPPSEFGVSQFVIRPDKFESRDKFSGVKQITFNLLDGHVSSINIGYDGPAYSHVDQFVSKFVEGTNLPPADQWQAYVGMDTQLKTLQCKDFEVRVFAGGEGGKLNYVLMRDLEADNKLKDRRKKAREKEQPSP